ncbi:Permease, MFS superfamily protein [Rhodococcus ruber BKS 20-38]|uniref:Permease, MFS superfamily protein n=1 Tax=Rhodococcus ruber BKS 20-38 TaxID=1278076 RepID=M2XQU1_9NOCA|nr:MFS transporter [Rhodococcus ruber]EME51520.1 Permease, MFS superfamily protein [Rhodococcus ruber BKS 20-38]
MAHSSSHTLAFVAAVLAFAVVMMGTMLPTPLYAIYSHELGFDVLTTTIIYSVYAAGVIAALIIFGRWSDSVGRKPLLIAGAAFSISSAIAFLLAGSVWHLMIGRVLSGLSAGIYAGAATAAVVELAPASWKNRAPTVATVANIGGLGLGPLIAGLLAQHGPAPLHSPFIVDLILLAVVVLGIWYITDPVDAAPGARLTFQRLSVPVDMRGVFTRAAIAAFAGFAVMGSFAGVAPLFVSQIIGIESHAVAGGLVATLLLCSALAQVLGQGMATESALIVGCVLLVIGVLIVLGGLAAGAFTLLLAGAVLSGVGQGLSFSKGLAAVVAASPTHCRAQVTSTYFLVAYVAISLPIVGQGFAAARWGLQTAGEILNIAVALLILVALGWTIVEAHRMAPLGR